MGQGHSGSSPAPEPAAGGPRCSVHKDVRATRFCRHHIAPGSVFLCHLCASTSPHGNHPHAALFDAGKELEGALREAVTALTEVRAGAKAAEACMTAAASACSSHITPSSLAAFDTASQDVHKILDEYASEIRTQCPRLVAAAAKESEPVADTLDVSREQLAAVAALGASALASGDALAIAFALEAGRALPGVPPLPLTLAGVTSIHPDPILPVLEAATVLRPVVIDARACKISEPSSCAPLPATKDAAQAQDGASSAHYNSVELTVVDSEGRPVTSMRPHDVTVCVIDAATERDTVCKVAVTIPSAGRAILTYVVADSQVTFVCLRITVFGIALHPALVPVLRGYEGRGNRLCAQGTTRLLGGDIALGCHGLAVNCAGTRFATATRIGIAIFDAATRECVSVCRPPGDSASGDECSISHLCSSGEDSILALDTKARRVTEYTWQGAEVREVLRDTSLGPSLASIAASGTLIALGQRKPCRSPLLAISLFDYETGEFLRQFGEFGPGAGCISRCSGLRFSADGARLAVADAVNCTVTVWGTEGHLLTSVPLGEVMPRDVDFTSGGDMVVAVSSGPPVYLFLPRPNAPLTLRPFVHAVSPALKTHSLPPPVIHSIAVMGNRLAALTSCVEMELYD